MPYWMRHALLNSVLILTTLSLLVFLSGCQSRRRIVLSDLSYKPASGAPDGNESLREDSGVRGSADSPSQSWIEVGRVSDGSPVFIDTSSVTHTEERTVVLKAKTVSWGREFVHDFEINCRGQRFRTGENDSLQKSSWRIIIPQSPAKLVSRQVCR